MESSIKCYVFLGEKFMILFNALQKSISAGIGRYSFELSKELYSLLKNDIKIIIRDDDLDDYKFVDSKSLIIFKNIKNSRDRNLCEQIYLPKLISHKYKDSLIHYPDSMAPILLNNKKIVITVHDLAFKSLSGVFTKKSVLWKNLMTGISVRKCNRIISITNFSKNELNRHYKNLNDKIDVVYNGFNRLNDNYLDENNISSKIKDMTSKKYVLTVSTISPRKNIQTLIKSFDLIKDKCDGNLIVVGSNGWFYEDIYKLVDDLKLKNRVIFTGKVNDDELKYLYKNSNVFVYPSIYEGFGLPPLEAMSYGVKTIVSNVECLREVLGDGVSYFDPYDYKSLSDMISVLLTSNTCEICDYSKILDKYSWKKCGEETLKVYDKVLKGE